MADVYRLRAPVIAPAQNAVAVVTWNGYALPARGRTFRRDELLELGRANGLCLSPALLHKWRVWELIPGPDPGGATGKGRGKGQTWPETAGWRVAWLARWQVATLSYDALRLAIWPWTRRLESDRRICDVMMSIRRFVQQDREFHDRTWQDTLTRTEMGEVEAYNDLLMDGRSSAAPEVLAEAGHPQGSDGFRRNIEFVRTLSWKALQEMNLETMDLAAYMAWFRATVREDDLITTFWDAPLSLARIVVREVLRYQMEMTQQT
jgi:hypothetical protein